MIEHWLLANTLISTADEVKKHWGNLHEIRHNMQEGAWTLRGQTEVILKTMNRTWNSYVEEPGKSTQDDSNH